MSLEYSSFSGGMMALLDDVKTSQWQDPGSIFNCHNHTFAYVTRPVLGLAGNPSMHQQRSLAPQANANKRARGCRMLCCMLAAAVFSLLLYQA